jgi:hypothetical protein
MGRYLSAPAPCAAAVVAAAIAASFLAAVVVPVTATEAPDPAPVIYDLVERWQLDPDDDDLVMGNIAGAVFDADGRCYLLDTQLAQIHVIDAGGDLVASLGRPGDGPGEFRYPSSLAWWDEQTLAVAHGMAGRLELIDVSGEPAGAVHFSRGGERRPVPVTRAEPFAGGLVVEINSATSDGRTVWVQTDLLLCDRDGTERTVVRSFKHTLDVGRFVLDDRQGVAPWHGWAVLPDGPLVLRGGHEGYALVAIDGAGAESVLAQRPYESLKRSRELIEAMKQELQDAVGANVPGAEVIVADTHPDITGLFAGPDGLLWVRTSRRDVGRPDACLVAADLHASDGRWLGTGELWAAAGTAAGAIFASRGSLILAHRRLDPAGRVVPEWEPCGDCRTVYVCYHATRRD